MKKFIYFIVLVLVGVECSQRDKSKELKNRNMPSSISIKDIRIQKPTSVKELVIGIEASDCIYWGDIGITGNPSMVYDYYKKLCLLGSDSLWLELSHSQSVVMRYYAYKAISTRNKTLAKKLKEIIKSDTSKVCFKSDDISLYCPVSFLIAHAR